MSQILLPGYEIKLVRYFSSRVKNLGGSSEKSIRQDIYWRALRTIGPKLVIHEGSMQTRPRTYPVYPSRKDDAGLPITARVMRTEEKGSDVALSAHIVLDAARNAADLYALISSDSDFGPTLLMLRQELDVDIAIFSPNERFTKSLLAANPRITRNIRHSTLLAAQFPETMEDARGVFGKPNTWGIKQKPPHREGVWVQKSQ